MYQKHCQITTNGSIEQQPSISSSSSSSSIHTIIEKIQSLHDKNEQIIHFINKKQVHHHQQNDHYAVPYYINTKIVATQRLHISQNALETITQFQSIHNCISNEDDTTGITISKNERKRIEKKLIKVVKNAEQSILETIQFGTSLDELLKQADIEMERLLVKEI